MLFSTMIASVSHGVIQQINMYMLKYGTGDFYNPETVQNPQNLTLHGNIAGPSVLCPEEVGHYTIDGSFGIAEDIATSIIWTPTPNLTITVPSNGWTIDAFAGFNVGSAQAGTLSLSFNSTKTIDYYTIEHFQTPYASGSTIDNCAYRSDKNITQETSLPPVLITTNIDVCNLTFEAFVTPILGGEPLPDYVTYKWIIETEGETYEEDGLFVDFFKLFH